jgi:Flp pilus assembly protein TadG
MTPGRGVRAKERGQAIVEIAVAAPMFLALMFGLVEVGRFAYFSIIVANAASAGAQYGSQNLITAVDNTGMRNAALADGQNIAGLTVTAAHMCTCSDGTASSCQPTDCANSHRIVYVQVDTAGRFSALLNSSALPTTFNVTRRVIRQVSQ